MRVLSPAALLALLVLAPSARGASVAGGAAAPAAAPLGFEALAVEEAAGIDVSEAHARLSRLVVTVRSRLSGSAAPLDALETIAEAVEAVCPQLIDESSGGLYSGALASGACDCDILTVTYLTIGETLGLPLSAVFLPNHVLVLWDDGREQVYWETTTAETRPRWFLETLVPEGAERAYLHPQSNDQMLGYFYQVRANYRFGRGDATGAFRDFAVAERLNPTFVLTFYNRGRAHLLQGDAELAHADYDRALGLDPTYADALYGRALAHVVLGRPEEALRDLDAVIAEAGESADVHHVRGLAFAALGRQADAIQSYGHALDLDPTFVLAYEERGGLHDRAGRRDLAVRDYMAFVRLAVGTEYEGTVPAVRERLEALGAGDTF